MTGISCFDAIQYCSWKSSISHLPSSIFCVSCAIGIDQELKSNQVIFQLINTSITNGPAQLSSGDGKDNWEERLASGVLGVGLILGGGGEEGNGAAHEEEGITDSGGVTESGVSETHLSITETHLGTLPSAPLLPEHGFGVTIVDHPFADLMSTPRKVSSDGSTSKESPDSIESPKSGSPSSINSIRTVSDEIASSSLGSFHSPSSSSILKAVAVSAFTPRLTEEKYTEFWRLSDLFDAKRKEVIAKNNLIAAKKEEIATLEASLHTASDKRNAAQKLLDETWTLRPFAKKERTTALATAQRIVTEAVEKVVPPRQELARLTHEHTPINDQLNQFYHQLGSLMKDPDDDLRMEQLSRRTVPTLYTETKQTRTTGVVCHLHIENSTPEATEAYRAMQLELSSPDQDRVEKYLLYRSDPLKEKDWALELKCEALRTLGTFRRTGTWLKFDHLARPTLSSDGEEVEARATQAHHNYLEPYSRYLTKNRQLIVTPSWRLKRDADLSPKEKAAKNGYSFDIQEATKQVYANFAPETVTKYTKIALQKAKDYLDWVSGKDHRVAMKCVQLEVQRISTYSSLLKQEDTPLATIEAQGSRFFQTRKHLLGQLLSVRRYGKWKHPLYNGCDPGEVAYFESSDPSVLERAANIFNRHCIEVATYIERLRMTLLSPEELSAEMTRLSTLTNEARKAEIYRIAGVKGPTITEEDIQGVTREVEAAELVLAEKTRRINEKIAAIQKETDRIRAEGEMRRAGYATAGQSAASYNTFMGNTLLHNQQSQQHWQQWNQQVQQSNYNYQQSYAWKFK